MKQYEEVFFSLVRAALWDTPVEIPDSFSDWGKVVKVAQSQTVVGLTGNVLLSAPSMYSLLPEQLVASLRKSIRSNILLHTVLNNTLVQVVSALREHGIESVLLKGQGIACNYPVPELRQCGDIDLYVGQENYAKAYDILAPISAEIDDKSTLETGKHFHVRIGVVIIEIHRYACVYSDDKLNVTLQKYINEGLSNNLRVMDFGGTSVNVPADGFNVFYVFNHLWGHFMDGGIGLRQFCDWMMLIRSRCKNISEDYLAVILKDLNLLEPWKALGCVLTDYLGLPSDEFPLYDPKMKQYADRIVVRVLTDGNFGRNSDMGRERTNNYLYEKFISLKYHILRYVSLFKIFPSHTIKELLYVLDRGFKKVYDDLIKK